MTCIGHLFGNVSPGLSSLAVQITWEKTRQVLQLEGIDFTFSILGAQ